MGVLDTVKSMGRRAVGAARALRGLPARAPEGTQPAQGEHAKDLPRFTPLAPPVLSHVTYDSIRGMLETHELGLFYESGQLAEHVLRDADLRGALDQRVTKLLGLPTVIEAAPNRASRRARKVADALTALWPRIAPRAALSDLVRCAVLMGFAVAQVVWDWDPERGELVPRLEPWPATHVQYRPWDGTWWAIAREGMIQITPGNGWFLYTPWSERRAHMYGALRCLAEWFKRSQDAARDASQYAEVRGQGVWVAEVPDAKQNDLKARKWIRSIKNLGRGGVIPAPQGADKASSYNVRVEEAKGNAFEIFDLLLRVSGARFRLALLGHNLTSNNDKVGTNASSQTGENLSADVTEADAETFGDALYQQVVRPWTIYYAGRSDLAPWAGWDAEPEADKKLDADTMLVAGQALVIWKGLVGDSQVGRPIDFVAMAEKYGVALIAADLVEEDDDAPPEPPKPIEDGEEEDDGGDGAVHPYDLNLLHLPTRRYVRRGHLRRLAA